MGRPPNEPNPKSGPLELFAAEHRRYRKLAGISQAELAAEIVFTPQFVGMVEVAARTPSRQYVDSAERVLKTGGGLTNCWLLASEMAIPKWFGPFVKVEAESTEKREWECMVIPGLLQTRDYALALAHAVRPRATPEQIEQEVEVRMRRQEVLHRPNPLALWAIIDENVLRRHPADAEVMRDQLKHLLATSDLPHVIIQVLPYESGLHAGQNGAFEILDRDGIEEIVWAETHTGGRFFDNEDQVVEYIRVYDHLRATALSPPMSRKLIASLLE